MTQDPNKPLIFKLGENEAVINPDGSASVTSSGGVEVVMDAQGNPKIAGVNAFGIRDLADVLAIETQNEDERTVFVITLRDGGVAQVAYTKDGRWLGYDGQGVTLSILNNSTKALIGTQ